MSNIQPEAFWEPLHEKDTSIIGFVPDVQVKVMLGVCVCTNERILCRVATFSIASIDTFIFLQE